MTTEITDLLKAAWNIYDLGHDEDQNRIFAICEQVLALEAEHAEALCLMSQTRFSSEDFEEADRLLNRAFQAHPDAAISYATRAYFHLKRDHYKEAKRDFDQAIRMDPDNARFYFDRANIPYHDHDLNSAVEDLNMAIRLDPDFAVAYHNRGTCYTILGDLETALKDHSKAIDCYHRFAISYYARGRIYERIYQPERAFHEYHQALQFGLKNHTCLEHLAKSFEKKGDITNSLALSARAFCDDIPDIESIDVNSKSINNAIKENYQQNIKARLLRSGDSFIRHWPVRLRWGVYADSKIKFTRQYGYGYLILTRYNLWLINLKDFTDREKSRNTPVSKTSSFFSSKDIFDHFFRKDRIFIIPHISIRSVDRSSDSNITYLTTSNHTWEIPPYDNGLSAGIVENISSLHNNEQTWEILPYIKDDVETINTALKLVWQQKIEDLYRPLPEIFSQAAVIDPSQSQSGGDAFQAIEKLKHLLDIGAITQAEFIQKRKELLDRI